MLQRIQTVYLLLALVVTITCLCLPIGFFYPEGMGGDVEMYNLCAVGQEEGVSFIVWPLFALLLLTCPINLFTIFLYNKRPLQASLCMLNIVLICLWIAAYCYYVFCDVISHGGMGFKPAFATWLPLVAIIFYLLARRGIISDEKLVRSTDRIR